MTITDFENNYLMYENMSIWEVKSLPEFFKAHENLEGVFEKEYLFPYSSLNERTDFKDSNHMVVSKLLDHYGDKEFYVFSNNDKHHLALKKLQDEKKIHFGIDIHVIHPTSVFVLEMDKTKDMKMYDR